MSSKSNANIISKEDLISMFLGLAIVGIVMIVLVNYFKSRSGRVDLDGVVDVGDNIEMIEGEQNLENIVGGNYTVSAGDSLWKIAVRRYGDGYKWVDIAKANDIEAQVAGQIEIGQKLILPDLPVVVSELPTEHSVVAGESLSLIALGYYGDMFAWDKIYQANMNAISNPNLIEIGMVLVIPE